MAGIVRKKAPFLGAFLFGLLLAYADPGAAGGTWAQVQAVVDGDTLLLRDRRLVRLIGINSPELGKDGASDEPLAQDARRYLSGLIKDQPVNIVMETEPQDRHGRRLAHVLLPDGRNVQEMLLEQGLASIVAVPPNIGWLERYAAVERKARAQRRGLWSHPYFTPVSAAQLDLGHTGFRFVRGRVQRIGKSNRYIYLDLAERFVCMIAREDWRHFQGRPEDLAGKDIEASGWVSARDGRLRLRVHHPAVLRVLD